MTHTPQPPSTRPDPRIIWHGGSVTREQRASHGLTVWLTGLPSSGKSTVSAELERLLVAEGRPAYRLDGDNLRHGLNADLRFSPGDRTENSRRVRETARLFADAGTVAIVSLVSPKRADRDTARAVHEADGLRFLEVFVDTPLEVCELHDPKGTYARARAGELPDVTGVSNVYEQPLAPDIVLRRPEHGDAAAMARIISAHIALL